MVKEIIKSPLLFRKAQECTAADVCHARDLADTLRANLDICVGMAANMIGVNKRIIVFTAGGLVFTMLNPVITEKRGKAYTVQEGCLSLDGTRSAERFESITVEFYDTDFKKQKKQYSGFVAQIIQHETDHCDGIMI